MEKIKEISVFAKENDYGFEMSYTNGKKWYQVKIRKECKVQPNQVGYWKLKLDATKVRKPQTPEPTSTGFQPNDIIWVTKENLISLTYDEEKNAEFEAKRLAEIEEIFA